MRFDQAASSVPPILHLTFFHPLDDHYGLAPLEPAAVAIDTHNAAAAWNKALLDNAARPSGALVYAGPEGAVLSETQFERLSASSSDTYQGASNAGRPLLLEGGLDWKAMSLSPKDMDFMEAKHAAAREIALAFGVPPMLLGIPGDNTYANYQEANRVLLPPDRAAARRRASATRWRNGWRQRSATAFALAIDTDRDRCAGRRPRRAVGARQQRGVSHAQRETRGGRLRPARGRGSAGVIFFPLVGMVARVERRMGCSASNRHARA